MATDRPRRQQQHRGWTVVDVVASLVCRLGGCQAGRRGCSVAARRRRWLPLVVDACVAICCCRRPVQHDVVVRRTSRTSWWRHTISWAFFTSSSGSGVGDSSGWRRSTSLVVVFSAQWRLRVRFEAFGDVHSMVWPKSGPILRLTASANYYGWP